MNLTMQQIAELPLRERRQFGACINYFLSKQYFVSKRNKQIMEARTKAELEIEDDRTSITEGV